MALPSRTCVCTALALAGVVSLNAGALWAFAAMMLFAHLNLVRRGMTTFESIRYNKCVRWGKRLLRTVHE